MAAEDSQKKDTPRLSKEAIAYGEEAASPQGDRWLLAIFSTAWMRLFNYAQSDDKPFIQANAALIRLIEEKRGTWPNELIPQVIVAARVARGCLAVLIPVPGAFNSSLTDVEFVHALGGVAAPISKELPRVGKLIASKLQRAEKANET